MNRLKRLAGCGKSNPRSLEPDEIAEVCRFALRQHELLDRLAGLPDSDKTNAVKTILSRRGLRGLR